jgi:hypothetical protein
MISLYFSVNWAGHEFLEAVQYVSQVWLPAKQVVAAAVASRMSVDPSGQVIVLKGVSSTGWALCTCEKRAAQLCVDNLGAQRFGPRRCCVCPSGHCR